MQPELILSYKSRVWPFAMLGSKLVYRVHAKALYCLGCRLVNVNLLRAGAHGPALTGRRSRVRGAADTHLAPTIN